MNDPLRRFTSRRHAAARFVAQHMILKTVVWSLTRVSVIGRERLTDVGGAFIVVANHSSHLDAPLITGALPRRLSRYLAAGAAADYFFDVRWRKWLTALFFNAFPVDRSGKSNGPGMSKRLLAIGVPLLIFPQGGRSRIEKIEEFKPGAAALSISSDVPMVPVAIVGASIAMPRGVSWPVPGRKPVAVVFGQPMRALPSETTPEFSARVAQTITELHTTYSNESGRAVARSGKGRK